MAKETLLDTDIAAGGQLIEALDSDGEDINGALWLYYPDLLQWKLLLVSPKLNTKNVTGAYTQVSQVLSRHDEINKNISIGDIKILNREDPLMELLKGIIRTGKGLSKIRMRSNVLNGIYVEDALIYRNV